MLLFIFFNVLLLHLHLLCKDRLEYTMLTKNTHQCFNSYAMYDGVLILTQLWKVGYKTFTNTQVSTEKNQFHFLHKQKPCYESITNCL
jgi:hypothetical protein